eukprot:9494304-Pyramimonas_sp.AAC.2
MAVDWTGHQLDPAPFGSRQSKRRSSASALKGAVNQRHSTVNQCTFLYQNLSDGDNVPYVSVSKAWSTLYSFVNDFLE